MKTIAIITLIFLSFNTAYAYTDTDAIKAIVGEAEGEMHSGKMAVACAIKNRGTLQGVYGLHAPRVVKHLYSQKIWNDAAKAWDETNIPDLCSALIGNANAWEGTAFKTPSWAKGPRAAKELVEIGHQRFYFDKHYARRNHVRQN